MTDYTVTVRWLPTFPVWQTHSDSGSWMYIVQAIEQVDGLPVEHFVEAGMCCTTPDEARERGNKVAAQHRAMQQAAAARRIEEADFRALTLQVGANRRDPHCAGVY
jgi:hypothetical protein